jgi:hypothetical protein
VLGAVLEQVTMAMEQVVLEVEETAATLMAHWQ